MTTTLNFKVTVGTDYRQPFNVTLDQGRELDGSETWKFHTRKSKEDAATTSEPTVSADASTHQPTVVFEPATLDVSKFPLDDRPQKHWYELEMVKSGKTEKPFQGFMIVTTQVVRT